MKVPLSWLKEYLDVDLTPARISEVLTLAGLEVEKIETPTLSFEGVIIGRIVSILPHPNADRLRLLTVTDGTELFQIVCGDLTCKEGQRVAFAKIGATLTDEEGKKFKIKKGKLRDIESFGMLCSEKELGLSDYGDSIMSLSEDSKEGSNLADLYSDTILEIGLTPNLGHAMSIKGVARELAAQLKLKIKKPHFSLVEDPSISLDSLIRVEIEDKEKCKQFSCRLVQNVNVGPSPDWLKRRLEACGVRSINNVVDVTNYILLDCGQPMHAYDYDTLQGKKIILSSDTSYTTLVTLDEKQREIPKDALIICDTKRPLSFAGIMGGLESSVTEQTKNILFESASFSPEAVRRTSKLLQLRSEGSQRFERGTDRLEVIPVLDRAVALLQQIAGGTVPKGVVTKESAPFEPRKILCRTSRVNKMLGTQISKNEITSLLERLEIHAISEKEETITFSIPSYRNDLQIEIDLVEEVGRLYGFNNIAKKVAKHVSSSLAHSPIYVFEKEVRSRLISEGLQECITCDLISPEMSELTKESALPESSIIRVLHPSSIDHSILRTSLLQGLLQMVQFNINHQNLDILAFEVGRIHFKEKDAYKEPSVTGIVLSGKASPYHWDPKPREVDFFDLKGIVENMLKALGIDKPTFVTSHLHNFHPGRQARILVKDSFLGALGEVHPSHLRTMGIEQRVFFAELNLHDLLEFRRNTWHVSEIPSYPGSERDWTLTLKEDVPVDEVLQAVHSVRSPLLENVALLDIYTSERLGTDRKNVTFRFVYREKEKTISFDSVEREHAKITQEVAKKLADRLL